MKKELLTFLLLLFTFQLHAADYYWVGGGGNWSDINHWRLGSSSGNIAGIVPSATDNVFFGVDAGFTNTSRTVTIDANSFCNSMTWAINVPNTPTINRTGTFLLTISGNLVLSPTVTYNFTADMVGTTDLTLTTNGPVKGNPTLTIKPAKGLTVTDDLVFATASSGTIIQTAGYFNASGKTIVIGTFQSNGNSVKSVDISNSIVTAGTWDYRGTNKTLNASGSVLKSGVTIIANDFYPEVEVSAANGGNMSINNCEIPKLTFTATSTSSQARIGGGNKINILTFLSNGSIIGDSNELNVVEIGRAGTVSGNYNTINSININSNGSIVGSGNNIGYIEIKGTTSITAGATPNTFGTLLTAPNKNITITRTNNITTLFRAGGAPCDGFTEITGSTSGTLSFAAGATADIDNVLLTDLTATGPIIPIAISGIDNDGNTGFDIIEPAGTSGTLYWVGGAGDWNDNSHWSNSSGGAGGACIPFKGNDVIFDDLSGFTPTSKSVTTSSNTYFNNMTWNISASNSANFTTNANFTMRAYGSVSLAKTLNIVANIRYVGNNAVTLTTNGNTLGTLNNVVEKTGTGGLKLIDDWNTANGRFSLNSGFLDLNGRNISIYSLVSATSKPRTLDIQNANINVSYIWQYTGGNKQIQSNNSYIEAAYQFSSDGLQYPVVHLTSNSSGATFSIANTTFNELLFTGTTPTNTAPRIGSNNTITDLVFCGGGIIGGNNTITNLEFKGVGYVNATGNNIGTLLTAPNRNYQFTGTTTINTRFRAVNPACNGLGEIKASGSSAKIVFGANATVDINNVYLENMVASGGGGSLTLPIPFSGADAGGNEGWTITTSVGADRYWVGGAGDWNDASHWSLSSGGTGGACIPTVGDDVYFDEKSGFTSASKTVTVSNGNAYFHNMSWAGALNSPVLNKSSAWAMECWGNSVILNPTVTLNIFYFQLKGPEATILKGNTLGSFSIQINKPGGSLTFANDYNNTNTTVYVIEGSVIAAGKTLTINHFSNNGYDNPIYIDISNATINGAWTFNGGITKRSLNATNSVINAAGFTANGFTYNIVNANGTASSNASLSNTTIQYLTFVNPSELSAIGINGTNNKLGTVEFKGSGGIYGTNNTIGTLIFFPGDIYTFTNGTNTTITGEWYGSGTPCKPTEIKSSHATATATITKTSGVVEFDYVRLSRLVGAGGATFKAKEHSTDLGGNVGWSISPYNGAAPILGLGPDVSLKNSQLPYTINTDGFFGSPLSQYEWKKGGIVISTANKISITEPGIYSVKVMFPDGCSITDDITISLVSTDLAIVKSVDNPAPIVGANVVFTLKATNKGPGAGTGITVTDQLPTGYTYISDTAPLGTTYNAVTGLWTIGNLASGADAIITITAKVNATGNYANTATISSAGDDPDPANNSSTVTLVPSPTVVVTQPNCVLVTGTIEVPLAPGSTYSKDGGATFQANNIFTNLEPDNYSIVVKIGDNKSMPVMVTINEAPAPPDAPVSGGNQQVCATSPIQTLTATATVPTGTTITWYDALVGGNVVANPTLNAIGTVIYYAQASNGICTSKSRTAILLNINSVPVITQLADQVACATYTLPTITGTNLTGNEAYYSLPNGGGIKYPAGAVINTTGTQTLYLFDKAVSPVICAGDIDVTANTDMSDNVLLQNMLNSSHMFYTRAVDPNFWKGTANQSVVYSNTEPSHIYQSLVGDLKLPNDPVCTGTQVQVSLQATFKNEGPVAGQAYTGQMDIVNKVTKKNLYQTMIQPSAAVGVPYTFSVSGIVDAADLKAGNLAIILNVETAQAGYKNWTLSNFSATYKYLSETPCPDEKSFKLTINPIPVAPVSGGDQEVCIAGATLPLTATATVPTGTTIIWYDAPGGGNIVASPTLSAVGTITYYAEAAVNGCVSINRTPVKLTINQNPVITPIADINSCGPLTLPAITGNNLSGTQAYYTGINKTGTKYNQGEVFSTPGETILYAYDEVLAANNSTNPEGELIWTEANYTAGKLSALFPDNSRALAPVTNPDRMTSKDPSLYASFVGGGSSVKYGAYVRKLELPAGYVNSGDEVLVSVGSGGFRTGFLSTSYPGNMGQLSIINIATNQLLYQAPFGDIEANARAYPSVSGLVSAADLIAGKIGVFMEMRSTLWRVSELAAKYQFVSSAVGCPAQQSFKVNINSIPAAPAGVNQTVCADSPVQTLTAMATVPIGSTVVWYDAATAGNVVPNPTLSIAGTKTYYAETHTGTCISATRTPVVLTINAQPVLNIQNPPVACHTSTIDLTAATITSGNPSNLQLTYFTDAATTTVLTNPAAVALSGTYYIKGTNPITGCSIVKPVVVQFVDQPEVTLIHPDCVNPTGTIKITAPIGSQFIYNIISTTGGTVTATADNTVFTVSAGTYQVTASNTTVPGCVSPVTTIVINATPTTAMPLVKQPACDETEGSIEFPVNASYQYAIDNGAFTDGNIFQLAVGTHTIKSKKTGAACEADAITVIIVASPGRPGTPIATDQQACALNPVQTLKAIATVSAGSPVGTVIKWYDALVGGNVIASPTLNTVGSITYYAEATDAGCTSASRNAVKLTLTAQPVINPIADINSCSSIILPAIAGANLSGSQAYYTAINGGGTKYSVGDQFSAAGETTLYAYDINSVALPGTGCAAQQSFKVLIRNTTAGVIGADQIICKNTAAVALSSTTAGTGLGTLSYRWESSSNASAGFVTIPGKILESYSPGVLSTTTYFRRVTVSVYGTVCESVPTAAVKITVQDVVTAGAISASQTICKSSSPATLTSATAGTGSGIITYRWESSTTDAFTGFAAIQGAVSADYSPAALTTNTWFRRVAISTEGANACESTPTTAIKITVQAAVTAGTISADQTVCNNTAAALTSVTAGTGEGSISYRWEKSTTSASTGFTVISGVTTAGYTPTSLIVTTWFRRITISTLDGIACESVPTTATAITVQQEVTAGVIGANQTVCFNTPPVALASTTDGTGSGIISYRWEQSSASAPAFAVVPGAILAGYTPGALTETTWFRRITISSLSGVLCESVPTSIIEIMVQEATSPGTIAASQTICYGSTPEPLTSVTAGTGAGSISYRWESSTTDALTGFASIPGAVSAAYTPKALTATTYFRRITVSTLNGKLCESAPTPVVTVRVQIAVTAGIIGVDQVICNNTVPAALSSVTAGTGSGTISYRWERSSFATTGFTAIQGATSDSYNPANLTTSFYFRRITISTQNGTQCESVPAAAIKITVQGAVTAGSISDDQTICASTTPAALTSTIVGAGSGIISYRWERSAIASAGFTAISGAQSAGYAPAALTQTTYFRRITISTENGIACESVPTATTAITVQDEVTAGAISANQTICNNTIPAALTSATEGTGSGTITYRWESSITGATTGFAALTGATAEDYAPGTLITTTYFRRTTISTLNGKICESAPTAVVTISVQAAVTAGTINGDQIICKNNAPAALTSTIAGSGSGVISYRWESSITGDNTGFNTIPGATSAGYNPGALTTETWFRRITLSTLNGVVCESVPTAAVAISLNNAPGGANQNKNTDEDVMLTGQVTGTDADGDVLTYSKQTNPAHGVAMVNTDGSYTYTPVKGYSGNDSFTIGISDGCAVTMVTINITIKAALIPAPSITLVKTGVFTQNYIAYSFVIKNTGNVTVYDLSLTDAKLNILNKAIDAPNGLLPGASITVTEKYIITQADKEAGGVTNTATINAKDGKGTAIMDISGTTETNNIPTITPVSKILVAVDDQYEADANKVIKENVLQNDDLAGQDPAKLTVVVITQPQNGTLVINPDGTFIYTPNPGYTGADSFTYLIKDEYGYYSNRAVVSLKINFFGISVPTLFTPNGDGTNDIFEVRGLNQFAENQLTIINRWGNEVYRANNYQNNWNGEGLNEGTYYYLLKVKKAGSSEWVIFKGYTTIVRAFKK
ncbi:MAG: Ig-like domain-containing protein [Candidatus Pedobacter colombiensis]|uniref:Ig-like domain-containing protein n=1 Tax=Candidatus Pedobacter colombiensis TaxID=3121371 RepID=A0AAJ6B6U0_9SPHI|nr:Ig-like domain-containing protein [Pedobacter sp.]WEK18826.1 MAG: Ig-like domain-containing protein [Pedobacter sp.]